ncbi:hypothetical protein NLJ89_g4318 [Agrocybe chaxingu]|uniref:DUF2470 domain-containing protein n=1 Tax=Agrocybe chaxingu TaxID=84603 RepID=A0A9W8MY28_9AGAR|nr:hypothetical protein NLJ89_g4318 [Agrocybe chaxingu]
MADSDPVAAKSGFLKMYMSSHPDTLVAYAKWFGKVEGAITGAEMSAIDCNSMTLTCAMKGGEKRVVRVPIEPPLKGYDDVKPRLLEMKAFAQEGLGMIKAPQITTFKLPRQSYSSAAICSFAYYLFFFGVSSWGSASPLAGPAKFIVSFTGTGLWTFSVWFIGITHPLEALYAAYLSRQYSTGLVLGSLYTVSTLIAGFPVWKSMRKDVQAKRIESVMKVQ